MVKNTVFEGTQAFPQKQHGILNGGGNCANKVNIGMYGVQESELQYEEG